MVDHRDVGESTEWQMHELWMSRRAEDKEWKQIDMLCNAFREQQIAVIKQTVVGYKSPWNGSQYRCIKYHPRFMGTIQLFS